ncbi:MAG: hypothetical protein KF796_20675 [Ramlibacter sp.]|nr:hypothetical protein [Ramlibacter sp.]
MIYETPELQRAFEDGVAAAAARRSYLTNPYPRDSLRAVTWSHGYNNAPRSHSAPLNFAPGAIEHHARGRRQEFWLALSAAVVLLCAVAGFTVGYFNPWGLFR